MFGHPSRPGKKAEAVPDETYKVELTPPDISAYREGNTGIPHVTTFDSGKPGPHVMINAHAEPVCVTATSAPAATAPALSR